jgi:hypothetical protein
VLRELDSIHLRHADVEQHHVRWLAAQHFERCATVGGLAHNVDLHLVAAIAQQVPQTAAGGRFIIDDENAQLMTDQIDRPIFSGLQQ